MLWLSITTGTTPVDICAFWEPPKASEQFLTGNFCWSICVMDIPKSAQLSQGEYWDVFLACFHSFFFFFLTPGCLTQILKLGQYFRFLLFTKQATHSLLLVIKYWERGCHVVTRVYWKDDLPEWSPDKKLQSRNCPGNSWQLWVQFHPWKKIKFFSWFGGSKGDTSQVPETTRIFFLKANKKNLQKCGYVQYSVFVRVFYGVLSVYAYICTGPWKLYLLTTSYKYVIFSHGHWTIPA